MSPIVSTTRLSAAASRTTLISWRRCLLTFALADAQEERRENASCHETYEKLLAHLNEDIDKLKVKIAAEVETAKGPEIKGNSGNEDVDMTGDEMSETQKLIEEREARGKLVEERRSRDVTDLATAAGVVWVMYMRFARRSEVSPKVRFSD